MHISHPHAATSGGLIVTGFSGLVASAADIPWVPHSVQTAIGIVGGIVSAIGVLYVPCRKLWTQIKTYIDPEKGASAKHAEATQRLIRQVENELIENTRITHEVNAKATKTYAQVLAKLDERADATEMMEVVRGEVSGAREEFGALRESVRASFKDMIDQFNGLGKSLRGQMSSLEDGQKALAERVRKLEEAKETKS